ncbi:MAG: hypothetical protein DMF88_06605 [Acidobacteria bacterium]|nr:MAG: hypothetical protein DMF88_06605 [Acidobacteriota bacterium]
MGEQPVHDRGDQEPSRRAAPARRRALFHVVPADRRVGQRADERAGRCAAADGRSLRFERYRRHRRADQADGGCRLRLRARAHRVQRAAHVDQRAHLHGSALRPPVEGRHRARRAVYRDERGPGDVGAEGEGRLHQRQPLPATLRPAVNRRLFGAAHLRCAGRDHAQHVLDVALHAGRQLLQPEHAPGAARGARDCRLRRFEAWPRAPDAASARQRQVLRRAVAARARAASRADHHLRMERILRADGDRAVNGLGIPISRVERVLYRARPSRHDGKLSVRCERCDTCNRCDGCDGCVRQCGGARCSWNHRTSRHKSRHNRNEAAQELPQRRTKPMRCCRQAGCSILFVALIVTPAYSQTSAYRDPSPHAVRFVTVERRVRLEVLDWGGTGRPVVLLAGGGNTAHVFDDFAPKLAADHHVYGITRRGFGASGFSISDQPLDRLRDDVLAVIDALKLKRPVIVGHSIAGAEMSAVATSTEHEGLSDQRPASAPSECCRFGQLRLLAEVGRRGLWVSDARV